jgi:hypothetical protein
MPMPLSRTQLETARLPHPPEPANAIAPATTAAVTASSSPNGIVPKPSKPLTKSPHASAVVPAKTAMTSQMTTPAMITVCSFSTVR